MTLLYRRLDVHLMPFFLEYLPAHKGVSTNTVQSYRDAWTLLLRFGIDCKAMGKPDDWRVNQVDRTFVLEFLTHLEEERKVCERTRNLRLAAIHSFFRYLKGVEPDLEKHCERILAIPSKKATHKLVGYLDPEELLAMFKAVRLETPTGPRDLAILLFAYNTAARVHEIAQARKEDIMGASGAPYVRILGKGRREREIPLWGVTQDRILAYHQKAMPHPRHKEHASSLFLSIRGQRLTRYQIGRIITTYIRKAAEEFPDMRKKRLHAHSIRHTTAVHLLMADVEVNTIKAWLGHASIETLQIYTALNVRKKREVLDKLITPAFLQCCQPSALDGSPGIPLLDLLHGL